MTLNEIIKVASDAYPDGLVELYHTNPSGNHGDGLARFIAVELKETYDAAASAGNQIYEAWRTMRLARAELDAVCDALEDANFKLKSTATGGSNDD